ncbi:MAG: ribbon-helix-helix protein, CopG family [Planctomycetota bacterium]
MRTSKVTSVSLPPRLLRDAERLARTEGRTKSELFREALRRYIEERRWSALERYGAKRARELGIKAGDVDRLVAEYRREQRPRRS